MNMGWTVVDKYITINNEDYLILDEIIIDDTKYVYLSKENDEKSLIIQKVVIKDTIEHLVNLDSTEEYKKAFQKFIEQK